MATSDITTSTETLTQIQAMLAQMRQVEGYTVSLPELDGLMVERDSYTVAETALLTLSAELKARVGETQNVMAIDRLITVLQSNNITDPSGKMPDVLRNAVLELIYNGLTEDYEALGACVDTNGDGVADSGSYAYLSDYNGYDVYITQSSSAGALINAVSDALDSGVSDNAAWALANDDKTAVIDLAALDTNTLSDLSGVDAAATTTEALAANLATQAAGFYDSWDQTLDQFYQAFQSVSVDSNWKSFFPVDTATGLPGLYSCIKMAYTYPGAARFAPLTTSYNPNGIASEPYFDFYANSKSATGTSESTINIRQNDNQPTLVDVLYSLMNDAEIDAVLAANPSLTDPRTIPSRSTNISDVGLALDGSYILNIAPTTSYWNANLNPNTSALYTADYENLASHLVSAETWSPMTNFVNQWNAKANFVEAAMRYMQDRFSFGTQWLSAAPANSLTITDKNNAAVKVTLHSLNLSPGASSNANYAALKQQVEDSGPGQLRAFAEALKQILKVDDGFKKMTPAELEALLAGALTGQPLEQDYGGSAGASSIANYLNDLKYRYYEEGDLDTVYYNIVNDLDPTLRNLNVSDFLNSVDDYLESRQMLNQELSTQIEYAQTLVDNALELMTAAYEALRDMYKSIVDSW